MSIESLMKFYTSIITFGTQLLPRYHQNITSQDVRQDVQLYLTLSNFDLTEIWTLKVGIIGIVQEGHSPNSGSIMVLVFTVTKCQIIFDVTSVIYVFKLFNNEIWKGGQSGTYLRLMIAPSGPRVSVAKTYRDETKMSISARSQWPFSAVEYWRRNENEYFGQITVAFLSSRIQETKRKWIFRPDHSGLPQQ